MPSTHRVANQQRIAARRALEWIRASKPSWFLDMKYHTCLQMQHVRCRPCTNAEVVGTHRWNSAGYEGNLSNGDKVCYSCYYKSHLILLQEEKLVRTVISSQRLPTLGTPLVQLKHLVHCSKCVTWPWTKLLSMWVKNCYKEKSSSYLLFMTFLRKFS